MQALDVHCPGGSVSKIVRSQAEPEGVSQLG
jgi:hypothetical protein